MSSAGVPCDVYHVTEQAMIGGYCPALQSFRQNQLVAKNPGRRRRVSRRPLGKIRRMRENYAIH